ncbi:MAG: FAD-dependent oxidoreductase [Gammaproteobacteria bacterium]|nr:FAD-dependent oxidoreductase [Gammaproteobacteria bacterium]MBU6508726.1 FAD-dependent oxidoreductase [Gammaproteobacteria bacterium]MDE1983032.1 FAD-dependent oxidoreductase [Gammaproteobacteria bacterium]MDE2107617.1 FAD-dependent oxidoreductase [Gammaproteobacteria bacterium]MDE2461760.1 FAD-dependent oxidoreductase [Gammaproteobacteria bacterium]
MAKIVVLGAGIGGCSVAYELRSVLGKAHEITVVNATDYFQFVPSNPWVAIGWRERSQTTLPIGKYLARKDIEFIAQAATAVDPEKRTLTLASGESLAFDYLVIATGAKLAFDEIPGLGPEAHTQSICTVEHAERAWNAYQIFVGNLGPVVIGAVQGASCFGPAYEFALIVDTDLRRRKLRDRVPMTFVTAEPYIGHLGLGGVGDSKELLEHEFRQRHIKWITNAKLLKAGAEELEIAEHNRDGKLAREHKLPSKFTMFIPAFKGVDAVAGAKELCNPRGFVLVDKYQRNPRHPQVYALGVGIAIPPAEPTPVPVGVPKTGYMIESMAIAIARNIRDAIAQRQPVSEATWNAVCLADMGDDGIAFVALPQIPPRNVTWAKTGKWVHFAKLAFEKYFLRKMKRGSAAPLHERYILKMLGIKLLKVPS